MFYFFRPSSFDLLDRRLTFFKTVQFLPFGPFNFIPLDRLLLSVETVENHFFRSYSPFVRAVRFWIPGPSIFADRPLLVVWVVQFNPPEQSTLTQDRPL